MRSLSGRQLVPLAAMWKVDLQTDYSLLNSSLPFNRHSEAFCRSSADTSAAVAGSATLPFIALLWGSSFDEPASAMPAGQPGAGFDWSNPQAHSSMAQSQNWHAGLLDVLPSCTNPARFHLRLSTLRRLSHRCRWIKLKALMLMLTAKHTLWTPSYRGC